MSDREQRLEKALRDCVMEPGAYSRAAALELLGLDLYGNPINKEPSRCMVCGAAIMTGGMCNACRRVD